MELYNYFSEVKDTRRKQGQRYKLSYILLFTVLSLLSNASSYRMTESFIKSHLKTLKKMFGLKWKRSPSHVQLRNIIIGLSCDEVEKSFRQYSASMQSTEVAAGKKRFYVALDGKTLRGSIDRYEGHRALHQITAFDMDKDIILGHIDVREKSNEIVAVQSLLQQLQLKNALYTMDAMHCQKKRYK